MPSVSFIIPSYNYAEHIGAAIESILLVKRDSDEIIIVDDGSTDDTGSVLSQWLDNNTIQYSYQENAGVGAARNAGARLAAGEYLYFLDADDRIISDGFSCLREAVESHPDKVMIFGGHCSIDGALRRCHQQKIIADDKQQNFIDYVVNRRFSIANGGAVLVKRDIALKYPYPENLKVSEDFCVYAWVLANETAISINDVIVEVRKHGDSLRNQTDSYAEIVERLPDIVFDPDRLPASLLEYKQRFYCNRLLSLFRIQYLAGEKDSARLTYQKAIRCRWLNILKLSYFRKFIRLLMTQ